MDRASDEYNQLQNEVQRLRNEVEKFRSENENLMRHQVGGSEQMYNLNCEILRHQEIAKRLSAAINQFIPLLPHEHQQNAINITERAKNVSPQEVMMQQTQQQFGMIPGLFGGPGGQFGRLLIGTKK